MEVMEVKASSSKWKMFAGSFLLIIVVLVSVIFLYSRRENAIQKDRESRTRQLKSGPVVKTAIATISHAGREILLIGEVRPYQSVTLYAKTSGYLDKIWVDKGDKVVSGQLLARIIAPEIDEDFRSAKADLENKKRILMRDESLLARNYISRQDKELSETAMKMAEAKLTSITAQQGYRELRAPFSGTVTARYADVGALMQNATSGSAGALPVVMISELDRIRIYVYVEQKVASFLRIGFPVNLSLFEKPQEKVKASINRIAGELDPRTRMMLTEIDMDNRNQYFIPGSFIQVRIELPKTEELMVPRETVVIRDGKYFVTLVTDKGVIHYQPVKIGENTGEKISILEGIKDGNVLALNIGESLEEGQKVTVQNAQVK